MREPDDNDARCDGALCNDSDKAPTIWIDSSVDSGLARTFDGLIMAAEDMLRCDDALHGPILYQVINDDYGDCRVVICCTDIYGEL